jgi:Protein of unknown function (DUF1688)
MPELKAAALSLLNASAVRARAEQLYAHGVAGTLSHFTVDESRIGAVADYVIATTALNYPDGDVPFHARWRHFSAGGIDRFAPLSRELLAFGYDALGRAAFDLVIVSVLLDAGAGASWHYHEAASDVTFQRSEGLGVASFHMFAAGTFSSEPDDPLRCDAERLARITAGDIAAGFQVSAENPLEGLEGRAALIRRLGETMLAAPDVFTPAGDRPRPGGLFDFLTRSAAKDSLPATAILNALLTHLGPIWAGRLSLGGVPLGDTWHHPLVVSDDATTGLVPFHKLSQWLAYSLIEPLQWAGWVVTDIDGLTGLPEYRNGGLMLDLGVIALKNEAERLHPQDPASILVVEWRALTVALLDRIAAQVRIKTGQNAHTLPLARVLEGGTWSSGRRVAKELRADGSPPLTIISDGTVF